MRLLLAIPLFLIVLTGCRAEYDVMGAEEACGGVVTAIGAEDMEFDAAADVAASTHEDVLAWSDGAESGFTMTVTITEGSQRYVEPSAAMDMYCGERVEAEVVVHLATDDGRLDEVYVGTLVGEVGVPVQITATAGEQALTVWFDGAMSAGLLTSTEWVYDDLESDDPTSADVTTVAWWPI